MRILLLTAFFTFIIGQISTAQSRISPYQFSTEFLAFENDVPRHYLFLIPDFTQQIIANPARAYLLEKGFFASNIITGDIGAEIRGTGLLDGKNNTRWLFSYSSGIQTDNFDTNIRESSFVDDIGIGTVNSSRFDNVNETTTKDNVSFLEARIVRIKQKNSGSVSGLGFVGAYSVDSNELSGIVQRSSTVEQLTIQNTQVTNSLTNIIGRNLLPDLEQSEQRIVLGLESFKYHNNSDVIRRLSYQNLSIRNNANIGFRSISNTLDRDLINNTTGFDDLSLGISANSDDEIDAHVFEYNEVRNIPLQLFGDDYLYINIKGSIGFGDNLNVITGNRSEQQVQDGVVLSDVQSAVNKRDTETERFHQLSLNTAYTSVKKVSALTVLTGVTGSINHSYIKNQEIGVNLDAQEPLKTTLFENQRLTSLRSSFPLFTYFDIAPGLSLWGGLELSYTLTFDIADSESREEHIGDREFFIGGLNNVNTDNSDIRARRTTYLGLSYEHTSGFKVIANFRDNLANTEVWRISVVYGF